MSKPMVSVIMSTYNENIKWLKIAIESIINQTFKDFEFIIILDNPKREDIKEIVFSYRESDDRIIVIENEENLGLVKSLNRGLGIASGKYIARMDADDISLKDRLELQYNFMEQNKDIDFSGANISYIDENGRVLDYFNNSLIIKDDLIKKSLYYGNPFNHPTWFFKKDIIEGLKEYREVPFAEDYDFVTRVITSEFKVANMDKVVLNYRMRQNGISQSNIYKQFLTSNYVVKMYKWRLKGNNDEALFGNLKNHLDSSEGQAAFERALKYNNKFKNSKGIEKLINLILFVFSSPLYLKLFVKRRLYLYYLNKK